MEIVQKIVEQEFGAPAEAVEEIVGKGKNNRVFKVTVAGTPRILRLNAAKELETYAKEKWCADAARGAGVTTPEILRVGVLGDHAFSFQEYVEGVRGADSPERLAEIWETLGRYAHIFNQLPAPEIELDYPAFVGSLFADDFFVARSILSPELSVKIRSRLDETADWNFPPRLCHGNLHPSNVILGADGTTYLIDWETATGNRAPEADLAEIYTWKTGKGNVGHFLSGYGLEEIEVAKMMRDIQTLVLLRLVHVIVRRVGKGEAWKEDSFIKDTAAKFGEVPDYTANILFTKNL